MLPSPPIIDNHTIPQAQPDTAITANMSIAAAAAGASNARYWMQMKNAARTFGKIPNSFFCFHTFSYISVIPGIVFKKPLRLRLQRGQVRGSLRTGLGEEWGALLPVEHRGQELD